MARQGKILNPDIETDASGYGKWTRVSGGSKCLKVEGAVPSNYTFDVVWRYYGTAPMPAYIDYSTGALLILDKVGKIVLFEADQEIEYNVLVKNSGTPVTNTKIAGLHIGL